MTAGASALPDDLDRLRGYMRMIGALLEEKAQEIEPSWGLACLAAREIETLQGLGTAVVERATAVRARSLDEVRAKLAIWRAYAASNDEADLRSPQSRLVLSVDADLERLAGRVG